MALWAVMEGCWTAKRSWVSVNAINRLGIKRPPNGTKFDRRSTGDIPRPLGKSRSIPRTFIPLTKQDLRGGATGACECGLDSERTTERTGRTRKDASFEKHADEMQMMTWQNATCKQMTWQLQRITGRHLAHRIRGVTAWRPVIIKVVERRRRSRRRGRGRHAFIIMILVT